MPEAEAIRLALQGNHTAFERLYRLHRRRVFALCVRMLENSAEAEDLTQETFLTVFRRIHAFRGETSFSTWLHLVTVTVVLLHIHNKIVAETSRKETTDRTEKTQAGGVELCDADLYLNSTNDRLGLQRAVDQVPPGFKPRFVLYGEEGYAHKEIADRRGRSTGTSKSQPRKSRRLRELPQKGQNNRRALDGHFKVATAQKPAAPRTASERPKQPFARKNPLCQLLYLRACAARQSSPGPWQQDCSIQTQKRRSHR